GTRTGSSSTRRGGAATTSTTSAEPRRGWGRSLPRPPLTPLAHRGLDVDHRDARRWTRDRSTIHLGDLGVQGLDPGAHILLERAAPDLLQLAFDPGPDIERRRREGEPLTLDELFHPPVRIVVPPQIGDGLALPEKIVEVALLLGLPD